MDYSELVSEVQHRSGVTDVASRAEHYVRSAERAMEKRLRVGAMEKIATITADETGDALLPDDFLQLRTTAAGTIAGNVLLTHNCATSFPIQYYAKIPSITLGPNWLSEAEPELYIQAVLAQVYTANGMAEQAIATMAVVDAMLRALEENDIRARHLHRRIDTRALRVRGI